MDSLFPQYNNHPAKHPGWKTNKSGIQTWTCRRCGGHCTRPATKGQAPQYCPACRNKGRHTPEERTNTCARTGCGRPARNDATYCSLKCSANAIKKPRPLVLYTGPPYQRMPKPNGNPIRKSKRIFKSAQCRVCDSWFVTLNLDLTCSPECFEIRQQEQKRIHKDRRRSRKKNAYVADVYRKQVFERDGYRCHLCGRKTNPKKPAPHPKSPTIDHIIPLAAGGNHEPLNCRTAHYICNALKGDRGGGEQFILTA